MHAKDRIGKLFLLGIEGTSLSPESREALEVIQPGMIILFQRNVQSPSQLVSLVREIAGLMQDEFLFAVDQEGGIVTRLETGFSVSPGAMALSATAELPAAREAGRILGQEMRACGITLNLAPVVDLCNNPLNPSLGVRSFGDTLSTVQAFSEAFFHGNREAGVAGCAKHFPGYGNVNADPHFDLPVLDKSLPELENEEMVPFVHLMKRGIECVMGTHLHLPRITKEAVPATISPEVGKGILRRRLGFQGVLITDDLTMGGIRNSLSVEEAAVLSLKAGNDVVDICHGPHNQLRAFEAVVEQAQEDPSLRRDIREALDRIEVLLRKHAFRPTDLSPSVPGSLANREKMAQITRKSITLCKNESNLIPLPALEERDAIFAVRPLRLSTVEDGKAGHFLFAELKKRFPRVHHHAFDPRLSPEEARQMAASNHGRIAVLFTENATLFPGQKTLVSALQESYAELVLVALRNPYDAGIPGVRNALLSYGYTYPSQVALLDVLLGNHPAPGICPVRIPTLGA